MALSWMTPGPVAKPFVEVGGSRVAAETKQYAGYDGYFHHALVDGLGPSKTYRYEVGHADRVVSPAETFATAPGARTRFSFTAFGDQGVDQGAVPPASQPPNQATANTRLARSLAPAFHLIVGDLAYANGDQAIWDTWFDMIEPMAAGTPWMPCIGNHEIEDQLVALVGGGGGWGDWGYDPYRTRFALPSNGFADLAGCFYAFRYGSAQFLMIDNNDVNEEVALNKGYTEGRQKAWVERRLSSARRDPEVDFIIVGMHQCAFSSSTKHGSDPGVQEAWFDLFERYSVDLVMQGHDHVYERTHGMARDHVARDRGPYRTDVGTVYVTVGNGGAVQEVFNPLQPEWSAFRQQLKVGTLRVDVDPFAPGGMRRLTLSQCWALNGSVIEEGIVLERPAASVLAAKQTPGKPTTTPAAENEPSPSRGASLPATGTSRSSQGAAAALIGSAAIGAAALANEARAARADGPAS
jgi:hypothetical protein